MKQNQNFCKLCNAGIYRTAKNFRIPWYVPFFTPPSYVPRDYAIVPVRVNLEHYSEGPDSLELRISRIFPSEQPTETLPEQIHASSSLLSSREATPSTPEHNNTSHPRTLNNFYYLNDGTKNISRSWEWTVCYYCKSHSRFRRVSYTRPVALTSTTSKPCAVCSPFLLFLLYILLFRIMFGSGFHPSALVMDRLAVQGIRNINNCRHALDSGSTYRSHVQHCSSHSSSEAWG